MSRIVAAPAISTNEDSVTLVRWHKTEGEPVRRGEILCDVETTKATVEVEADVDGFLRRLADEGAQVRIGAPLAAIVDEASEDAAPLLARAASPVDAARKPWTKKAEILARRKGIDIEALARAKGAPVTEADLAEGAEAPITTRPVAAASPARRTPDLHEDRFPANRPERVLLLGGGAGAGAMTVDVLARIPHQRAAGILDSNMETHGKTVGGVPVLGALDRIDSLWAEGFFDGAIILFTQDVVERARVFLALKAKGIRFANIIDPTVEVRGGTTFGEGNLIMARAFFSTAVTVGDNNFFASHCCVEHHSRIGSHCAFGPRTTTSGAVTIGDRVKTGMAVSVEPYISIGSDSLIASGCVITGDIPAGSVLKTQQGYVVRPSSRQAKAAS
jgi:sugar O-acyltransferase (sialic acid O-acetyltransferase NeuD family)